MASVYASLRRLNNSVDNMAGYRTRPSLVDFGLLTPAINAANVKSLYQEHLEGHQEYMSSP